MTTNLSLKHVWYEEIRKGLKKVEYRKIDDYYINKFLDVAKYKGKTPDQIKEYIVDGGEIHRNGVDAIMFYENGRRMHCPITEIKTYKNHAMFAIGLGKPTQVS